MKIRNGFVSNSSSCSYVVDFKQKISSPEDLEKVLNKNFWRDVRHYTKHSYSILRRKMPFKRICELMFRLYQIKSPVRTGRKIVDGYVEDNKDLVPTSFEEFRKKFMEDKRERFYYEDYLNSDDPVDVYYAEQHIWEEYSRVFETYVRTQRLQEILSRENVGCFSFGNESEVLYWDTEYDGYDRPGDFAPEEVELIEALRNEGLAQYLFLGGAYESVEYS